MKVSIVIPSYKVENHILDVIERIPDAISKIYVVDDACPNQSGKVAQQSRDPRVEVIFLEKNRGVGGATLAGMENAFADGIEIAIKIDGDGQMDPRLAPKFYEPILRGRADFVKGNRFYSPRSLSSMPAVRLVGNAGISFLAKICNGYWNLMDPTNGYLAIHTALLSQIEPKKISERYFFENDLLFRLSLARAVVHEVPMHALYANEVSSLSPFACAISFPPKFLKRFLKRIAYQYFLRDFNAGSIALAFGALLLAWGVGFGLRHWAESIRTGITASTGTVMLAALPTILGFQLLLFFLLQDTSSVPRNPIHPSLK